MKDFCHHPFHPSVMPNTPKERYMILDMEMKCENPEKRKEIYCIIN
jgi:hypothetical protein